MHWRRRGKWQQRMVILARVAFRALKPGHSDAGKMTRGFRLSERGRAHTQHAQTDGLTLIGQRQITGKIGEGRLSVWAREHIPPGSPGGSQTLCRVQVFAKVPHERRRRHCFGWKKASSATPTHTHGGPWSLMAAETEWHNWRP